MRWLETAADKVKLTQVAAVLTFLPKVQPFRHSAPHECYSWNVPRLDKDYYRGYYVIANSLLQVIAKYKITVNIINSVLNNRTFNIVSPLPGIDP